MTIFQARITFSFHCQFSLSHGILSQIILSLILSQTTLSFICSKAVNPSDWASLRLLFPNILYPVCHGNSDSQAAFWTCSWPCGKCGRSVREMNGLFCANIAHSRLLWNPCHSIWCGSCYTPHALPSWGLAVPQSRLSWRPSSPLLPVRLVLVS